ncbi:unnamed protein product [Brugia pahangi]|uniref:ZP domain-containing protein n=1 Tax=Brugia pahangi TaxID=6280 RepID=A0A0N4SZB4_BRUPA|nr:unnamed protein product [Brugia pahangi]
MLCYALLHQSTKSKYHLVCSKQLINNTLLPCSNIIYLTRKLNLVNRSDDIILSEKQLRSSVNKGEFLKVNTTFSTVDSLQYPNHYCEMQTKIFQILQSSMHNSCEENRLCDNKYILTETADKEFFPYMEIHRILLSVSLITAILITSTTAIRNHPYDSYSKSTNSDVYK